MLKKPFDGTENMTTSAAEIADRCRHFVAVAGGNRAWDDTRESWLARAARRLGITPARATTLFYRKTKTVPAHEYETLRLRVEALEAAGERRQEALREVDEHLAALDRRRRGLDQHVGDQEAARPSGSAREGR